MKNGRPEASTEEFVEVNDGDVTVFAPSYMSFANEIVEIDLVGFLWMVNLVAVSARLGGSSGCSSCSGGCGH